MNIDILLNIELLYALLIGISVGSVSAYVGSLMLTKRTTLMAGALGHLTLPGVALALKYSFDVSLGALIFLIFGIICIWFLERKTQLPVEALTAVVFTSSAAISFLFIPEEKIIPALLGDISQLNIYICLITLLATGAIFIIAHSIFKNMILLSISQDIAQSRSISSSKYNFIYLGCIALIVALGVRIIGGLMTAALVAIPASTSKNISTNLRQYAYLSFFCGGFSCIMGVLTSYMFHIPIGSTIILSNTLLFIFSIIFKK